MAVFAVLAWYRLAQLRPELASISATLLLHHLLLDPEAPPSWRRVLAAVALLVVWANTHALFMVGPLLLGAALAGVVLRGLLARRLGTPSSDDALRVRRLAAALGLGLLAALLNPRGVDQHLAFLAASRSGAIWVVLDEWARFDPFAWSNHATAVSAVAWVTTDLLLAAFLLVGGRGIWRLLRRPSEATLREVEPVGLALGVAAMVAMLSSIRFLWMGFFPLLFLLRAGRAALARHPGAGPAAAWSLAAGSLALALLFPLRGGFATVAARLPSDPLAYLATPYDGPSFFIEGVRFLEATGVEGKLFNSYAAGGFLCHRLGPRLRTGVDGSMNYPREVHREYDAVNRQRGAQPFESDLDVLKRWGVDLFFGVGVPLGGRRSDETGLYTTANLERATGWIPVSRSFRHAIYLRRNEGNRENLRRIGAWYASQGVPFDPVRGFDPGAVIRVRPDWAVAHGLVPPRYPQLLEARSSPDPEQRFRALEALGLAYALVGAYSEQIEVDREAVALRPDAKAPLRRLVYGLLRLGHNEEALAAAERLRALDPDDPRSSQFVGAAIRMHRRAGEIPGERLAPQAAVAPDAAINALPLLRSRRPLEQ
jgi:hypothetical protein